MSDVGVTYTLVTPAGTVTFNSGLTDQFYIGETQGLEGAPIRAPIDDVPFGDGGIVHDFWEGPRHIVFDGIFLITSTRVENSIVVIRNQMEDDLRVALRSIMSADGTLTWTPQGQATRVLTVRNDVTYDASHTDNYLNLAFHFGLVAANPDWDGGRGFFDWEDVFNAREGLLVNEWTANYDYSAALVAIYPAWGTGAGGDIIQFLRPAGFTDIFLGEVNGGTTDAMEPDWTTAPNLGDNVADGGTVDDWWNVGPLSNFAAILPWTTDIVYIHYPGQQGPFLAGVTSSLDDGHVYVSFPGTSAEIDSTGDTEPAFPTDGNFVVGNPNGYWLDMGPVP